MRKSTRFPFSVALGFSFGMMLAACAAPEKQAEMQEPAIGGERDAHGCLPAAGQSWSAVKQQCVQPFNVANIRLEEKQGSATFGIDVILSDDRQRAEIFSVSLPEIPFCRPSRAVMHRPTAKSGCCTMKMAIGN